ncbi:hypothetical protein ANCDUO_05743 [Ancylostoma duodenale]|uniref:Uncharacterized protein n=1 Tax=Ancylostoma duodenale TaxID=51022 RepID=A0A0C2GRN8_9BILA|nr:hypothetical protein ANCDUO_05743 [Ancylostoma duodenale]
MVGESPYDTAVRWIRSRDNGRDHDRHVHEKESSSTEQSEEPPNSNEPDQKKPKSENCGSTY